MRFLDPRMPRRLLPRLRRLFARAGLEREEVNILRGILARIDEQARWRTWRAESATCAVPARRAARALRRVETAARRRRARSARTAARRRAIALPTARQFLKDAAGRYVSLDGRLWRTLAALLFRPGFLTREYLAGRRRRYVRPARLFLVLSIAMFALFRVVVDVPTLTDTDLVKFDARTQKRPGDRGPETQPADRSPRDVEAVRRTGPSLTFDKDANLVLDGPPGLVTDPAQAPYRSLQRDVARATRWSRSWSASLRYGPYAMVVLLPAFALLLKLLYLGRGAPLSVATAALFASTSCSPRTTCRSCS